MLPRRYLACALAALPMVYGGARAAATACPYTEDDVIGAWILPTPGSDLVEDDAREFTIERNGDARDFREYLHHRPMGGGTWRFNGESCVLMLDYGDFVEALRLVRADEPQLVDESGQIYRRLADSASQSAVLDTPPRLRHPPAPNGRETWRNTTSSFAAARSSTGREPPPSPATSQSRTG